MPTTFYAHWPPKLCRLEKEVPEYRSNVNYAGVHPWETSTIVLITNNAWDVLCTLASKLCRLDKEVPEYRSSVNYAGVHPWETSTVVLITNNAWEKVKVDIWLWRIRSIISLHDKGTENSATNDSRTLSELKCTPHTSI